MKRKMIRFFSVLLILLQTAVSCVLPVHAAVKYDMVLSGIYMKGDYFTGANFKVKTYQGNAVYCIEPNVEASWDQIYDVGTLQDYQKLSAAQKQTVSEFAYFGYGYQGHQNGEDYVAAQYLIWNELDPVMIQGAHFYTTDMGDSRDELVYSTIERVREDIRKYHADAALVLNAPKETGPVGNAYQGSGEAGDVYTFTDTNGVLKDMALTENDFGGAMQRQDNTVTISLSRDTIGDRTLCFQKNTQLSGNSPMILYDHNNQYQTMGIRGDINKYVSIKLHTGMAASIQKSDGDGNSIAGSSLKLVDADTNQIIDNWISDLQPHSVHNLEGDHHYTVYEGDAPVGYYYADAVTFLPREENSIMVVDEPITYAVEKKDENGLPVKNASLSLYDVTLPEKKLVKEWRTGLEPEEIGAFLKAGNSYSIVENDVSTKYFLASDTEFTVPQSGNGKDHVITITDAHIHYELKKVDDEGNSVKDATLVITDVTDPDDPDRVVLEWHSTEKPLLVNLLERGHTYQVRETECADGYYKMEDKIFQVPSYGSQEPVKISCVDARILYQVTKTDPQGNPVKNAGITLYEKSEQGDIPIRTFLSGEEPQLLRGLRNDTEYVCRETAVPAGYYQAEDVSFYVSQEGNANPVEIRLIDDPINVKVKKTDLTGKMLPGSILAVIDQAGGKEVCRFETGEEETVIGSVLLIGHTYIVKELEAPSGYYKTEEQVFTVPQHADHGITITMQDAPIQVSAAKIDVEENPLPGASLALYEKETKITSWISGKEPQELSQFVKAGTSYEIREEASPDGYYFAAALPFTVEEYGPQEEVFLRIKDLPIQYEIQKVDEAGEYVSGVKLRLSNITEKEPEVIKEWTTREHTESFDVCLKAGSTYLLEETELAPGHAKASSQMFTIPYQGTMEPVRISMVDATNAISFLKTDEKGKPLAGSELEILDEEGTSIAAFDSSDDQNGIHVDENGRDISSCLMAGSTYILHEIKAPFGYRQAEDIPFTMSGTLDAPQMVTMMDQALDVYVKVDKRGAEGNMPLLSDCEITVLDKDTGEAAFDLNGNTAKALTDDDGTVSFRLPYTPKGYLVQETKAPEGYSIDPNKKELTVDQQAYFSNETPQQVHIVDQKNVDTGVDLPYHAFMALVCACGCFLLMMLTDEKR